MHFDLSEERKMLKESCDRLLNDHYTKHKNHHEVSSSEIGFNKNFWKECSDIGMLSALISPNFFVDHWHKPFYFKFYFIMYYQMAS